MYHNSKTGETREPLPYKDGNPICHDPLYDAGVLGNICYDEGDRDTCDPGFVDRGFGCEREESEESLFEEISGISGMTISPTPQLQTSVELNNTISDLLRLLLTQEVTGLDRILLIDELEQVIQSLLMNSQSTVNIEFDTEDDGNEKVLTITTTSTLPEMTEETAPIEESAPEEEESSNGGSSSDNGGDSDPEPEPQPDPEPEPQPQPGEEVPGVPFG